VDFREEMDVVRELLWRLMAGAATGVAMGLAFPDVACWPLLFVAFVPVLMALRGQGPWARLAIGLSAGTAMNLAILGWVQHTLITMSGFSPGWAGAAFFVIALLHGIPQALLGLAFGPLRKGTGLVWIVAVPTVHTVLESFLPRVFPFLIADGLHAQLPWIQIADVIGVRGVSWMLVASSCVLVALWELRGGSIRRQMGLGAVLIGAWAVVVGYGHWRLDEIASVPVERSVKTALVQPLYTVAEKQLRGSKRRRMLDRSLAATETLRGQDLELVVWSEGAFPWPFPEDSGGGVSGGELSRSVHHAKRLQALIRDLNVDLLTGSLRRPSAGARARNSAIHLGPDGSIRGVYDKRILVPFGEYVPLRDHFPEIAASLPGVGDLDAGDIDEVFEMGNLLISPNICYEAIHPDRVREALQQPVNLLVNFTNDVWFGPTKAAEQHLMLQTWRAVEMRVPMIRATNSGVSAFVTATGEITGRTPVFEEAILVGEVEIRTLYSFYREWGDLLLWWMALMSGARIVWVRMRAAQAPSRDQAGTSSSLP
jgi:apolipoprotein N-acyltransferase